MAEQIVPENAADATARQPGGPEQAKPPPQGKRGPVQTIRTVSAIVVMLYLIAAALLFFMGLRAAAFGFGVVFLGLAILHGLGRTRTETQPDGGKGSAVPGYGIFRTLIGTDQRFSTSLTQIGLWTLAATTGFAFLLGRHMFDGEALATVLPGDRWDQYLILLGGPFAAAVLAKTIVATKVGNEDLQKPPASAATPGQVLTSDKGGVDLVDAQYLLFNLIALAYYVITLCTTSILPDLPAPLLAMTSATAALYAANKATLRNAPLITAVSPRVAGVNEPVTIHGQNFDPVPDSELRRNLTVNLTGTVGAISPDSVSNNKIVFTVPVSATAGIKQVSVVSSAGLETAGSDIEIRPRTAIISQLDTGTLRPGRPAALIGENLGSPDDTVTVKIGTLSLQARATPDGRRLRFDPPKDIPEALQPTALLTVSIPRQPDVVTTVPIEQPRIRSVTRADAGTIAVAAVGIERRQEAIEPRVLCNGRPAALLDNAWRAGAQYTLTVQVPPGVVYAGEIRVQLVDDLGRESGEWLLPAAY